ncbi:MAG: T9SS type A sorting domain-containing protein, partial [Flavobacterium sp.]
HIYVDNVKYAVVFPKSGTSYPQGVIDALTFEFNNHTTTQETIGVSNFSVTYPSATLPVSLSSFTGKLNNNFVDLKWTTSSEQKNSHFIVSRSADSKSFTDLDRVEGKGTTTAPGEYVLIDKKPLSGTNYYQLKQYDLDGKETVIEKIVAVKTTLVASDFTVFINQENQLIANILSDIKTKANIGIFDITGHEVLSESLYLEKGNNSFMKSLPFLAEGVYVLKLSADGNSKSMKLIK